MPDLHVSFRLPLETRAALLGEPSDAWGEPCDACPTETAPDAGSADVD
jgi:hypothetical protein